MKSVLDEIERSLGLGVEIEFRNFTRRGPFEIIARKYDGKNVSSCSQCWDKKMAINFKQPEDFVANLIAYATDKVLTVKE